ncbi:MAG: hypothetical protein RLZZ505_3142 [Verrucomicrobiota bacterium]
MGHIDGKHLHKIYDTPVAGDEACINRSIRFMPAIYFWQLSFSRLAIHISPPYFSFVFLTSQKTMIRYLIVIASLIMSLDALTVHVTPHEGGIGDGSEKAPFSGIERALEKIALIRTSHPDEQIHLILAGGNYRMKKPLVLDASYSGIPGKPHSIRSAHGQKAILSLEIEVAASEFEAITDPAVTARLAPEARGRVKSLNLTRIGVKAPVQPDIFGRHETIEVFQAGKRLTLSRWPNVSYAKMGKVLAKGMPPESTGGIFRYRDNRAERWQPALADGGVWLRGFWRVPWTRQSLRVKDIDPKNKTITFAAPLPGGIGSKYGPKHAGKSGEESWQVMNLLEEIDTPGEWSVNAAKNVLYIWPPTEGADQKILVSHIKQPVISIKGASDITLHGLDIEGTWGHGVSIEGGSRVTIQGCRIRNAGGCGVFISGGSIHRVLSCDISETGGEGIRFTGGNRKTLAPGGHHISNNLIHHIGVHAPVPAITAGEGKKSETVGNRVDHNRIHDVPNSGIVFAGNDNVFERNEIYRVGLGSSDLGGIYTNSGWTARGNVIRHNFIHHSMNANAVYLDDGSCGTLTDGNIIWKCGSGGFIGGGHDQTLTRNLILECTRGMHIDDRGVSRDYSISNRSYADDLASVPYQQDPWKSRYPELVKILASDTRLPRNIRMEQNIIAGCGMEIRKSGKADHFKGLVYRNNTVLPTAGAFIDESRMLAGIGFKPVSVKIIGLKKDALRPEIPPRDLKALREKDTSKTFDSQTDVDAGAVSKPSSKDSPGE